MTTERTEIAVDDLKQQYASKLGIVKSKIVIHPDTIGGWTVEIIGTDRLDARTKQATADQLTRQLFYLFKLKNFYHHSAAPTN